MSIKYKITIFQNKTGKSHFLDFGDKTAGDFFGCRRESKGIYFASRLFEVLKFCSAVCTYSALVTFTAFQYF